ncbi:MAG: HNH endonuclease [Myxococcales bacterium]|nr:HNH endonuclease [Myxococcales bacterium]
MAAGRRRPRRLRPRPGGGPRAAPPLARALHTLPRVSEALSAGKISYSKTRAITRVATAATEAVLLGYAQHCTASQLETVCRKVGVLGADSASRAVRPHDSERYVAHTTTASGMVCVKACLRPDEAALLLQVLQQAAVDCTRAPAGASAEVADVSAKASAPAARAAGTSAETSAASAETSAVSAGTKSRTITARRPYNRADGLMALVHDYARGTRAERAPVELIVTVPVALLQQTAATTDSATSTADPATADISSTTDVAIAPVSFTDRGASLPVALTVETDLALSPQATRRLACDCGLVVASVAAATTTDATPLSIGRKTRTIPAALKRALLLRDRTCRFPGCDHRLFLEGHHLQHWADGGETNLDNLALLCSLHHAYVHERGYRITQSATGALAFEDPQGRAVVPLPPRPAPPLLGWPAIHAANAALPLTASTGQCRWRGERVDSWDAAATITRIQRRAAAAAATAAPTAAPPASPPPAFPRTPAPRSPPSPLSSLPSLADPPLDPDGLPLRGLWDDLDRHSAIERWVLAEMEATGVDPLSVGRPLPDHLQHPSQRPSPRPSMHPPPRDRGP